jgi:hypothetical protein
MQRAEVYVVGACVCLAVLATHPGLSQTAPATSVTLAVPATTPPLGFPPVPYSLNTNIFGTWYVDGAVSGLALLQSRPMAGDRSAAGDVSNAQVIVQKIDGLLQFYVQLGDYALPSLGTRYDGLVSGASAPNAYFGFVPQAFFKFQPSAAFSVQAGKLPTLIGAEYSFTFENPEIERGLLWNQEPAVSRGVQANYALDKVAFSLSLNDGYYADRLSWLSGAATWTPTAASTLTLAAAGNLARTKTATSATPLIQNNSMIWNLIYTYAVPPLVITPYVQYSRVEADATLGVQHAASTYAAAVLATRAVDTNWTIACRGEFIGTTGSQANAANDPNFLYGAGSKAASLTLAPIWSRKHLFFARNSHGCASFPSKPGTDLAVTVAPIPRRAD